MADEIHIVVSVTDRSERDLVKRFDELDIEWPIVETGLAVEGRRPLNELLVNSPAHQELLEFALSLCMVPL
jgi:hypothetical protein